MEIPIWALLFQGIPEAIAIVTLAFVLTDLPLEWPKIIIFGLILAFTAYFIRLLSPTFGLHTIILMGMLFIIFVQICNVSILTSLKASLITTFVVIITESAFLNFFIHLFGLSWDQLNQNIVYRVLVCWPQILSLFLLSYIIIKWRRRKGKANESFRNKSAHLR